VEDMLKVTEVAKRLCVSRQVVYLWVKQGLIEHVRIGHTIRIPGRAIEAHRVVPHAIRVAYGSDWVCLGDDEDERDNGWREDGG
jgi:excisionase family DNA binding protein